MARVININTISNTAGGIISIRVLQASQLDHQKILFMSLLNILSFILAVIAYGLKELQSHNKLRWMYRKPNPLLTTEVHPTSFWGRHSDERKYKFKDFKTVPAPNSWYYNFFKIKYKEKFPLSATALVFLTDGYHLCQWFFTKLLILSIITFEGDFSIKWFLIYLGIWYLIFNLTYKLLSK